MRYLIYFLFIFGILLVCSSCANKQYQSLFQQRNKLSDSLSAKSDSGTINYHIKSQDILEIRNLQNSKSIVDLNPSSGPVTSSSATTQPENYQVEEDGTVALTGLGHVKVIGLTRYQAQKLIEGLYRASFLKDPIIEVKIINLKVTILGEVRIQGNYPLVKDKTSLIELLGEAGGLSERADEKNIEIIRGTEKEPKTIRIDLNNLLSINDPSAILQSGDIIYISQNKRATRSDNLQSFSIIVQPALILFNTALIIFTLVHK